MNHFNQADKARFALDLNFAQTQVLSKALDLYMRLGLGQLEQIDELVRLGSIPNGSLNTDKVNFDHVQEQVAGLKLTMGFDQGSSWGVGSEQVSISAKRAYEIKKTLDREVAMHRNPNPSFRGVDYDGVIVRYTDDDLPVARVVSISGA